MQVELSFLLRRGTQKQNLNEADLTARLDTSRFASVTYPISSFARKEVVFYLGEVVGDPKVCEGEIDKYQWVTATKLKDYLFPDTFEACKALFSDQNLSA